MTTRSPSPNSTASRLTKVESSINSLAETIGKIDKRLDEIDKGRLSGLQLLTALGTAIAISIAIGRLISSGPLNDIDALKVAHQEYVKHSMVQAQWMGANGKWVEQITARTEGFERNHKESVRNLEIRMLERDAAMELRVTNGPMHELREKTSDTNKRLDELRKWVDEIRQSYLSDKDLTRMFDVVSTRVDKLEADYYPRSEIERHLDKRDARIAANEAQFVEHLTIDGHPQMSERVKALAAVVTELRKHIAAVDAKADANGDEDFKRPEAEALEAKIIRRIEELESSKE